MDTKSIEELNVHLSEIIDKQFKLDEKQVIEKDILNLMNKEVI